MKHLAYGIAGVVLAWLIGLEPSRVVIRGEDALPILAEPARVPMSTSIIAYAMTTAPTSVMYTCATGATATTASSTTVMTGPPL